MIKTSLVIMNELKEYASPRSKISRMMKSGTLTQVRRGLFVEGNLESQLSLSTWIYGPSYLSFQYALAYYGLIPERVFVYTCASYNKNKDKEYHTPFGVYQYKYLPSRIYPYGVLRKEDNGQPFLIASPEKALCDSVYKIPDIHSVKDMQDLLFEDWRMEEDEILSLDVPFIQQIAPLYQTKSVTMLAKWFSLEG